MRRHQKQLKAFTGFSSFCWISVSIRHSLAQVDLYSYAMILFECGFLVCHRFMYIFAVQHMLSLLSPHRLSISFCHFLQLQGDLPRNTFWGWPWIESQTFQSILQQTLLYFQTIVAIQDQNPADIGHLAVKGCRLSPSTKVEGWPSPLLLDFAWSDIVMGCSISYAFPRVSGSPEGPRDFRSVGCFGVCSNAWLISDWRFFVESLLGNVRLLKCVRLCSWFVCGSFLEVGMCAFTREVQTWHLSSTQSIVWTSSCLDMFRWLQEAACIIFYTL